MPITSTRPYLIRALYEWCADNGYTPFIAVSVDPAVRVPAEYVRDGEIVLNVSMDATSGLLIGNEAIEFKGRFGGVARDIYVPIGRVLAIYSRENGQGMAFPLGSDSTQTESTDASLAVRPTPLKDVGISGKDGDVPSVDLPPRPPSGTRPTLTRIK